MWTILNLVEKQRFDDLNWEKNIDIVEIITPPLALAKTLPKSYLSDSKLLFQSKLF